MVDLFLANADRTHERIDNYQRMTMNRLFSLIRAPDPHPLPAFVLAAALTLLVAWLDGLSGFELRLTPLYLLPVSLATWSGGLRSGLPMIALSLLLWIIGFHSTHPYSRDLFFYWEGLAMAGVAGVLSALLARLRQVLTRSDERFRRVLEEMHAAVYATDPQNGQVLYANEALARLIGADPQTLDAHAIGERLGLSDLATTPSASTGNGFVSREVRSPNDGRWFLVKSGTIPWRTQRTACLHVVSDISAQKQAETLRRQHQEILHRTSRQTELAEVASSLAHELNQPLMAIASYSDACLRLLAKAEIDRAALTTALQRSREQASRAGKIIARVRSFVRSKQPSPGRFDMNDLARESLEHLQTQLEDRSIAATLHLADESLSLYADRTLLAQVILNLLQNAIDAMAETPSAERRLSLTTARGDAGEIVVSVADQGPGVPEEFAEQAYAPLFTTKARGLGLGLAICRSIVEGHGGRLWHAANADGGSTFHFSLPTDTEE